MPLLVCSPTKPRFRIEHDRARHTVEISVSGFWKAEEVPAFAQAVGIEAQAARALGGDFDVIVESLDFPVQAHDVAALLTNVMIGGTALTSGRVAVVVGSQLNLLQARRTLVHPRLRVFLAMEEARNWLTTPVT